MYTYSVSGYDVNNKKFSPCSLRFIRKVRGKPCGTQAKHIVTLLFPL